MTLTITEPTPISMPEAGVIEDARRRQRRRWGGWAAAALVVAATVAIVAVLGGGSSTPGRLIAGGGPLSLTFKGGVAYENGRPIKVGIAPALAAGQVGLDVVESNERQDGEPVPYPTVAYPVLGGVGYLLGSGIVGPDGEVDVTLVASSVASMRVNHLGTFKPVKVLGLLAGERAFAFYRPPGARGSVLGPGISPHVLHAPNPVSPLRLRPHDHRLPLAGAAHEPVLSETLYNAFGKPIPIGYPPQFHLPSSYWQAPARAPANARCLVRSTLAHVRWQWAEVATAIAPDNAVSGPAFLSCFESWYQWHGAAFEVGILLNAQAPGRPPAVLWNATPLPGHAAIVNIKAVQEGPRFTLAPGTAARRVGDAWLLVRGANNAAQRQQFLAALRVTRLELARDRLTSLDTSRSPSRSAPRRRQANKRAIPEAVALGGFSTALSANTTGGGPAGNAVRARLRSIIVQFARQNGDSYPTDLRMVETTSTAIGAGKDGQGPFPVYDVAANGHFVANGASHPPGAKAPTGIGLWIVLKRNSSFSVVGWGIDRFAVNLRKLGKVQNL
jgi:hypothetical protein